MYGCESWTIKKAECQRIGAFKLWCWRRLLRVPWTARRSNQSILKETSTRCSLEGLMLKLKLQYFGHLMWRIDSSPWCWERFKAGREGDDRGWDGCMVSPTRWTLVWASCRSWWWTGRPGALQSMGSQSRTRLRDWTELRCKLWKHKCNGFHRMQLKTEIWIILCSNIDAIIYLNKNTNFSLVFIHEFLICIWKDLLFFFCF